ncbi:Aldose sugar dehydrogenase YliI [Roseibaca ekhonensis]|uniref:Aldose sugar dehydrogenase YliI n=1 Tax=Roseinatronobacter ekhonensis TaxID=254356 RepID=A0A3B0MBG4_9RHOB|nr:PQQ-dependent sugar dehydrogenase [Roseibaca ekhonensis]SUZ33003.1 Aldose sugar dehydrogenase YliI [Roseibaca ekhonensis]
MHRHLCTLLATGSLALATPAFAQDYTIEVLQEDLARPWAMAFLPGSDRIALTLRGGDVLLWYPDGLVELSGAPDVVMAGQGGLLDIAPAPDFAESGWLYMTWTGAAEGGTTTHLGRARLDGMALRDLDVLHAVSPGIDSGAHFGSRIAFADGFVFAGFGDRGFKNFGPDHIAQDLSSENGSVIRLTLDGEIPGDNPFVGQDAAGAIWSYGHRNIQAMAVHPGTGDLWLAEHGEAGGDEVNIVQRGGNYGWPLVSHGVTYRGGDEFAPPHRPGDGFVAPVFHWPAGRDNHNPPSGMAFYDGGAFPDWQGHLLIGNLLHRYLGLYSEDNGTLTPVTRLLEGEGWRIRDVAVGPQDGFIYVLTDGDDGKLIRLRPAG